MAAKIPSAIDPADDKGAEFLAWLNHNWERCKPFLQKAVDSTEGRFDLEYVWAEIMNGNAQLWPGEQCAVVTRIEQHPSGLKSVLHWLAGGGGLEELRTIEARISTWAKETMGCTRSEIIGRRGWLRALDGFREGNTVLVKDL